MYRSTDIRITMKVFVCHNYIYDFQIYKSDLQPFIHESNPKRIGQLKIKSSNKILN